MEHESLLQDPHFWVLVSFVVMVALGWKPIGRMIAKTLDSRSAEIARELAEAKRLREEAQAMLVSYQQKQQQSLAEAESIVAQTKKDAARMGEKAEQDLKASLDKRTKQSMDKIAQAETKALQEVQAHVVDIAIAAARTLITEHLARGGNAELVKQAANELQQKLH